MAQNGLECPNCGSRQSSVTNSRPRGAVTIWRCRKCVGCGMLYHTFECHSDTLKRLSQIDIEAIEANLKSLAEIVEVAKGLE